jgi:hypothetical protein
MPNTTSLPCVARRNAWFALATKASTSGTRWSADSTSITVSPLNCRMHCSAARAIAGPGVAAPGLEQQRGLGRVGHLAQHVLGEKQVVLVGHDHQVARAAGLAALDGLLEQGGAAKFHEGLGKGLPRRWPKPGACPPRKHN